MTTNSGEGKSNTKGILEQLPYKTHRDINEGIHEIARKARSLASGVRAYKRNVAPLAAIFTLQSYENFESSSAVFHIVVILHGRLSWKH